MPIASAGDGAGSIRIPAASCGLFGLKPSRGRVSLAPDLEGWDGLAVEGCLSRTVLDTALWLDIVSGGSSEPEAPPPPERPFVESAKAPPGKLRVAWSTLASPRGGAADRLRRGQGGGRRRGRGARLARPRGRRARPRLGRDRQQHHRALPRRGRGDRQARFPIPSGSNAAPAASAGSAASFPDGLYERARTRGPRAADSARVNAIFDSHDVLITPVMGGTALPVRRWEGRGALRTVLGMSRFYPYCVPWNHLGNPAMAVPFGFAADGMPLSVQIVGRPGDEATLLSLAAQLEAERPWADARPPIS